MLHKFRRQLRSFPGLIDVLQCSLEHFFSEKIEEKFEKIEKMFSKDPRRYYYIEYEETVPYPIQWWKLLNDIRRQGYHLNMRIHTQIQKLQEVLLFDYIAEILEAHGFLKLPEDPFLKQIMENVTHSRSFIYQLSIAANYLSNRFNVSFPEITGSGTVDVKAEKDGKGILVECKSIEPPYYNSLAAEILRIMQRARLNKILFVKINKPPYDRKSAKNLAIRIIKSCQSKIKDDDFELDVISLPHIINETVKYEDFSPIPHIFNWLPEGLKKNCLKSDRTYFAGDVKTFGSRIIIKNPKIIILKEQDEEKILTTKLLRSLRESKNQLEKEDGRNFLNYARIICVDLSNIVGRLSNIVSEGGIKPIDAIKREKINSLKNIVIKWLESHQDITDVVLSVSSLYMDRLGSYLTLKFECIPAMNINQAIYPRGWCLEMMIK